MERTLTTHGHGTTAAPPDAMTLQVAAVARAGTAGEALETVAQSVRAIAALAREAAGGATVSSLSLQVWPREDHEGHRTGFEARHSLRVVCPGLESAAALVDRSAAATAGFALEGVVPTLLRTAELESRARAAAFADARAKAEEIAALAGLSLGEVLRIDETGGGGGIPRTELLAAKVADTHFETGSQVVSAGLTVTWALTAG